MKKLGERQGLRIEIEVEKEATSLAFTNLRYFNALGPLNAAPHTPQTYPNANVLVLRRGDA